MQVRQKAIRPKLKYKSPKYRAWHLRKAVSKACMVAAVAAPLCMVAEAPEKAFALNTAGLILGAAPASVPDPETEYEFTHYAAPYADVTDAISDEDTTNGIAFASATSAETPCTLREAMDNATSDDIIRVAAGVCIGTNTGDNWSPVWEPANSGTAGHPIIFVAENPAATNGSGWTELRHDHSTNNNGGSPAFGASGVNYIIFDGFYVDERESSTHTDTGPTVIFNCTGVEFRRCVVEGDPTLTPNDNHNGIRLENATSCVVSDCKVYNIDASSNPYNGSAIEMYDCRDTLIEYNELYDCGGGVFVKGMWDAIPNEDTVVRFNYIHGCARGITMGITQDGANNFGTRAYQNIIDDCDFGLTLFFYAQGHPEQCAAVNNLIINCSVRGVYYKNAPYVDVITQNNLIVNSGGSSNAAMDMGEETSATGLTVDYNLYHNPAGDFAWFNGSTYGTLAAFVAATPFEDNGQDADPLFENEAGGDYRLSDSSPALNAGVDILNLLGGGTSASINQGPYISAEQTEEIGVRAEPSYS